MTFVTTEYGGTDVKEESAEREEATKFPPILITRYWIKSSRREREERRGHEGVAKSTKFTTVRMEGGRASERCARHSQVGIIQRRPVRHPSFQF